MSITDLPPCGWRASTGLQYLQAVTFAQPPSGCVVAPVCSPPLPGCVYPMPAPGGFWFPAPAPPCLNLSRPASLPPPQFKAAPGVNFIAPKNITTLHIFIETGPPKDSSSKFKPWQIDSSKTVQDILEHHGKGSENWAIVEYHEAGDGNWKKGITVRYKDDRAKKEICKFGWTPRRRGPLSSVWLAIERVSK